MLLVAGVCCLRFVDSCLRFGDVRCLLLSVICDRCSFWLFDGCCLLLIADALLVVVVV